MKTKNFTYFKGTPAPPISSFSAQNEDNAKCLKSRLLNRLKTIQLDSKRSERYSSPFKVP